MSGKGRAQSTAAAGGAYRTLDVMRGVRALVSKKKRRFKLAGFDLDLTYILPNVIAMGFPSTGSEGLFRNPMPEVQRFFQTMHGRGKYLIINLCSERAYDPAYFDGNCLRMPFDDHNPPPLDLIGRFCDAVDSWLAADASNVVAVHCKAGKGRTGCLLAAYLLHCGFCATTEEALTWFGRMRTSNGKGVTIPSQMRYVHYYEHLLRYGPPPYVPTLRLTHIRMVTVPTAEVGGGCTPTFRLYVDNELVFDYKKALAKAGEVAEAERAAAARAAQRAFEALSEAEATAVAAAQEAQERQWTEDSELDDALLQRQRAQSYGSGKEAAPRPTGGVSAGLVGGEGVEDEEGVVGGGRKGAMLAAPAFKPVAEVLAGTAANAGWVPYEVDPTVPAGGGSQRRAGSPRELSQGTVVDTGEVDGMGDMQALPASQRYLSASQRGLVGSGGSKYPRKRFHRFGTASANLMEHDKGRIMTPMQARRAAASAYAAATRAALIADSLGSATPRKYCGREPFVDFDLTLLDARVAGNVRFEFDHVTDSGKKHLCHLWFHTAFVEGSGLRFTRQAVDKANKDKKGVFAPPFALEVYGHAVPGPPLPPLEVKVTGASAGLAKGGAGGPEESLAATASRGVGVTTMGAPSTRPARGNTGKMPWGAVEEAAVTSRMDEVLARKRTALRNIRNNAELQGALLTQRQVRSQVIAALNAEAAQGAEEAAGGGAGAGDPAQRQVNWDSDDEAPVPPSVVVDGGLGVWEAAAAGKRSDKVKVTLPPPSLWSGLWTDSVPATVALRAAFREAGAALPSDSVEGGGPRDVVTEGGDVTTLVHGLPADAIVSMPTPNSGMYGPPPPPSLLPGDAGEVDILGLPTSATVRVSAVAGGVRVHSDSSSGEEEEEEQFDDYEQQAELPTDFSELIQGKVDAGGGGGVGRRSWSSTLSPQASPRGGGAASTSSGSSPLPSPGFGASRGTGSAGGVSGGEGRGTSPVPMSASPQGGGADAAPSAPTALVAGEEEGEEEEGEGGPTRRPAGPRAKVRVSGGRPPPPTARSASVYVSPLRGGPLPAARKPVVSLPGARSPPGSSGEEEEAGAVRGSIATGANASSLLASGASTFRSSKALGRVRGRRATSKPSAAE